jgi:hypothetical protein
MVYHLPFRDWLELNSQPSAKAPQIASNQEETDGSGDSAPVRRHSGR